MTSYEDIEDKFEQIAYYTIRGVPYILIGVAIGLYIRGAP